MADFNFVIPLQKQAGDKLTGTASSISVDRDDERMSDAALDDMVLEINKGGLNLFGNHKHEWEDTMGALVKASRVGNSVDLEANLDNPETNPKIPMLLNKLDRGINLGFSVGGTVLDYHSEYNKQRNKKIKVFDKVKIYEVSVVGIPSNTDSVISIPGAIAKSIKEGYHWEDAGENCPCCNSQIKKGACPICLWGLVKMADGKEDTRVYRFLNGQRVGVVGVSNEPNEGIVMEVGDKYKVKFDDGTFGFFNEYELYPKVEDTQQKAVEYPARAVPFKMPGRRGVEPAAAGEDPLAQPKRDTGRSVGEEQTVLGKETAQDPLAEKSEDDKPPEDAAKPNA